MHNFTNKQTEETQQCHYINSSTKKDYVCAYLCLFLCKYLHSYANKQTEETQQCHYINISSKKGVFVCWTYA